MRAVPAAHAVASAAQALRNARASGTPIGRVSDTYGITDLDVAYAVAAINTELALVAGRVISGKKIGLSSKGAPLQLNVDRLNYGVLFHDMELQDGDILPMARLMQPRATGTVAFVIGRDLEETPLSWGRFLIGIEYALPAIEIVDCALADWQISLSDTVADNASSGLYVLGTEPRRVTDLKLHALSVTMQRNGETVSVGPGTVRLAHPLKATHWLARTMASLGQPLRAGDVVLSGALGPMFALQAGDELVLDLPPLGRIHCRASNEFPATYATRPRSTSTNHTPVYPHRLPADHQGK